MRVKLLERRREMLNNLCKNVSLRVVVEDLSRQYEVSEQAIYKDWRKKEEWINLITGINDPELKSELLQGLREIIAKGWYIYATADNSNAKVGALRLIMDAYSRIVQFLQSVGKMEKIAEQTKTELGGTLEIIVTPKLIKNATACS